MPDSNQLTIDFKTITITYTSALGCFSIAIVAGASLTPKYAMLAGNSSVEFDFSAATLGHTGNSTWNLSNILLLDVGTWNCKSLPIKKAQKYVVY